MANGNPSPELLRHLFSYDPKTGVVRRKNLYSDKSHTEKVGDEAGYIDSLGYANTAVGGRRMKLHRIIWAMVYGEYPEEIDHIDGDPGNNRISNLRNVSKKENLRNKKLYSSNSSRVSGVRWYAYKGQPKWSVRISAKENRIHVGYFEDFFEACCARKAAENAYGYHANHGLVR